MNFAKKINIGQNSELDMMKVSEMYKNFILKDLHA